MPYEKDPDELGALWIRTGARGEFLSGVINGQDVVAFRNTVKKSHKQPDYRVMKSRPKPDANKPPATDDF